LKKPSPLRFWKTLLPGSGSFDYLTDISYLNSRRLILGVIPEQGFTKGDRKAISHLRLTRSRGKCFRGHLARFRREKRATPGDTEGGGPDKGVFPGQPPGKMTGCPGAGGYFGMTHWAREGWRCALAAGERAGGRREKLLSLPRPHSLASCHFPVTRRAAAGRECFASGRCRVHGRTVIPQPSRQDG